MNTQPEALRLAEVGQYLEGGGKAQWSMDVCAELRRLHALNQELLEALKHAAHCVQDNYCPDMMGNDWDDVIAKAEGQA